jgi:undecaprenyl phosphate-alpha-L-ara4FN deformylase
LPVVGGEMILSLKIDVDTERGTKIGVPNLLKLFKELNIPATFLFSLGPDNTGRALKRIFRPGFLKKVARSNVVSMYGFKTLLNGVLWPGPHIAKRHANIMRMVRDEGHEVGIHCYDHIRWQDGVSSMSLEEVMKEFQKACDSFFEVFETQPFTAGAAGWQANEKSLEAYDKTNLLYGSDARGITPFFPRVGNQVFKTLQIPTTLPTLDELLGRPEYPESKIIDHYLKLLNSNHPNKINIFTMHAEIEGMAKLSWFREFLLTLQSRQIQFKKMDEIAKDILNHPENIPVCDFIQGSVDGRSGVLATQKI